MARRRPEGKGAVTMLVVVAGTTSVTSTVAVTGTRDELVVTTTEVTAGAVEVEVTVVPEMEVGVTTWVVVWATVAAPDRIVVGTVSVLVTYAVLSVMIFEQALETRGRLKLGSQIGRGVGTSADTVRALRLKGAAV